MVLGTWLILLIIKYYIATSACNDLKQEGLQELKSFKYCLRQAPQPSVSACIGRSALNFIQRFDEQDNFTVLEDFVSTKDDKIAARSLANVLDTDPVDFRGILENAGAVFSQRSLEWHMDGIYPGLMFKIGPTADANSLAEFVLDSSVAERQFGFEEPSTARVLTQQYLLPFLLGLKFNLVALVPLLFAGICLLLKKSLFFAKLAIYVSSFLGFGGALGALSSLGGGLNSFGLGGGGAGGFNGFGFGGVGGAVPGFRPPVGHFPGKTTVYTNYDELHHNDPLQQPYKRSDRKMNFEYPMPRSTPATPTPKSTPAADRFYDYERTVLLQDRSIDAKQRSLRNTAGGGGSGGAIKLGPSAYDEQTRHEDKFRTGESLNGWQVVDLRV